MSDGYFERRLIFTRRRSDQYRLDRSTGSRAFEGGSIKSSGTTPIPP
jgi:hypothetical protein